jgi:hypothetical protein
VTVIAIGIGIGAGEFHLKPSGKHLNFFSFLLFPYVMGGLPSLRLIRVVFPLLIQSPSFVV